MKKLLFVALALFSYAGTGIMAQENNSDADNDRKEKAKEFITKQAERMAKNLKLDDAKTKTFTDLLVEYRTQEMELRMSSAANRRQENRKKRSQMTDAQADSLIQARFELEQKQLELKKTYYDKFRKDFTPSQLVNVFMPQPRIGNNVRRPRNFQNRPGGPQGGFGGPDGGFGAPRAGGNF